MIYNLYVFIVHCTCELYMRWIKKILIEYNESIVAIEWRMWYSLRYADVTY